MRYLFGAAFAAGMLLVGGGANAQDTVRLGGPSAQADIQGGTDIELVHRGYGGYRGGYYGGGYRGGYYGGYRGGYYGGYRGYYAGYRGYYGGYAGYYRPNYYRPYIYAGYYSPYYYSSYYYDDPYYYPINGSSAPASTAVYQAPQPGLAGPPRAGEALPLPLNQGTFPYDGGPRGPAPAPNAQPIQNVVPNAIVPIDGRLVSMPTGVGGGVSPVGVQRTTTTSAGATRVSYPAYGEEPIPAVPRKR